MCSPQLHLGGQQRGCLLPLATGKPRAACFQLGIEHFAEVLLFKRTPGQRETFIKRGLRSGSPDPLLWFWPKGGGDSERDFESTFGGLHHIQTIFLKLQYSLESTYFVDNHFSY